MDVNEFVKKNNVVLQSDKIAMMSSSIGKPGSVIVESIYNALQKFNATEQFIKKVLQNTYAWYELLEEPEVQIKDFVKEDGKLDESGLYFWLITD